jgi:SAM-dependent methyltransferase
MFLCDCLEQVRDVSGHIVEIGCSAGKTTIFLNRFLKATGAKRDYLCLDTFSGFTEHDVEYEVENRGKQRKQYGTSWADWSRRLFEMTMKFNGFDRVRTVEADVNEYAFNEVDRIAFCLVDVDLYLPVKSALTKVYEKLTPGGIIVVDDCVNDHKYDGARQAYSEFVREEGLPEVFRCSKFGVIPSASDDQNDSAPRMHEPNKNA